MRSELLWAVLLAGLLGGCAVTTAIPIAPNDRSTLGFRVYEAKPLLVVSKEASKIIFIPNYSRPYAVRFDAFLAKNHSKITTDNGIVKDIDANLDTTAIIQLFQQVAKDLIPGGKGGGVEAAEGELYGVYDFVFDDNGNLLGLRRLRTDVAFRKRG